MDPYSTGVLARKALGSNASTDVPFGTAYSRPLSCARFTYQQGFVRFNRSAPFQTRTSNGAHRLEISVPKLRGDRHGDVFASVLEAYYLANPPK